MAEGSFFTLQYYSFLRKCFGPNYSLSKIEQEQGLDEIVHRWCQKFEKNFFSVVERELFHYILYRSGANGADLRRAGWCNLRSFPHFSSDLVLPTAELLCYLRETFVRQVELAPLVKSYVIPPFEMTEKRASEFSLRALNPANGWERGFEEEYGSNYVSLAGRRKKFGIYLDAPISLALFHHEEPRALVSVLLATRAELRIYQIQGVRAIHSYNGEPQQGGGCLGTLHWKELLVGCVEELARIKGYDCLSIQGAKNNRWVNCGSFSLERAVRIYDKPAERLGYSLKEDGNWHKKF